ncbi:hypothetical protein [Dolichospermum phage Dfl-JY45]
MSNDNRAFAIIGACVVAFSLGVWGAHTYVTDGGEAAAGVQPAHRNPEGGASGEAASDLDPAIEAPPRTRGDATLERELTADELADVTPCVRDRLRRALSGVDANPLRVVDLAVAKAACRLEERADAQRAALGVSDSSIAE